jgi:hypothetical protein
MPMHNLNGNKNICAIYQTCNHVLISLILIIEINMLNGFNHLAPHQIDF